MKTIQLFTITVLALCSFQKLTAQSDCDVLTVQPSIMVLPRTNEGENLRTIMDEQPEVRVAISKVKQAFDERGYTTMDFETTLRAVTRDETVTSETQTEFKNRIFRNIPSDIVVEIDVIIREIVTGPKSDYGATLILEANVTDNGNSMASITMDSGLKSFDDKISLISVAMRKKSRDEDDKPGKPLLDVFLETMNDKWAEMREKGKTVKMEFSLSEDAEITMDDDVPSQKQKLTYVIEDWLEENSYHNYYSVTSTTSTKIMVSDYRYPVRDPKNCTNMTPRKI
ncbi:MAG: hypothetical protein DSY83_11780, partial [Flavobacteriia bacterium]